MLRAAPRVLVVDDDPSICDVIELILTDDGCEVQTRPCGQDALECLQQWPADVILLDLLMPGMDAEAFLAAFREQMPGNTSIVLLSAATGLDHHADRLGVQGWLVKPFGIDELCLTVRQLVAKEQVINAANGVPDGC